MYYGRGDYRTGYYRRGDPLSLGGIIGSIGSVARSFITGGPVAALRTGISEIAGTGAPKTNLPMIVAPNIPISTFGTGGVDVPKGTPGAVKTPGLGGMASRILPGGMSGYEVPGATLSGYHVIKKGPHAGQLARNRRMNVTNPRALRRGLRRIQGFGKLVQRMKRAVGRANTAVGNKHTARRRAFGRR